MKSLFSFLREDQIGWEEAQRKLYSKDCWTKATFLEAKGQWKLKPEIVLFPESEQEVVKIVQKCAEHRLSVVPYGGGSGVCGATLPEAGGVVVDMKRMERILALDTVSQTLDVEAGIYGVDLEAYLNRKGFTLGHFPASLNASTIGGYLACRSAGQCSSRYGKIEDMVLSLRAILPDGKLVVLPRAPKMAMGPDFVQLFTGAEGTLGIITAATFVVRRLPKKRVYLAFSFSRVEHGVTFMREVMQQQLRPSILRLYDPLDTLVFKMTYRQKKKKGKPSRLSLRQLFLRYPFFFQKAFPLVEGRESLLVAILEGDSEETSFLERKLLQVAQKTGGKSEDERWAKAFFSHRYGINFFLPQVLTRGFMVDTCEVVGFWNGLPELYHGVLSSVKEKAILFAHFSHAYETGCCIYFTFLCKEKDYEAIWKELLATTARLGGCLSHHHGIGKLKMSSLKTFFPDQVYLWEKMKKSIRSFE